MPDSVYLHYAARKVVRFVLLGVGTSLVVIGLGGAGVRRRVAVGAALVVLLVDLGTFGLAFKVSQDGESVMPSSRLVSRLQSDPGLWRVAKFGADVLPANTATLLEIEDVHGYDALNMNHYLEVLGKMDPVMISAGNAALRRRIGPVTVPEGVESPVLDLLNVKYVLSVHAAGGAGPTPVALVNEDRLERAFLVGEALAFETQEEVLREIGSPEFDPGQRVLIVSDDLPPEYSGPVEPGGEVKILNHRPNRIAIEASCDRPCFLVLSDAYYPGWEATVDGEPAAIIRADYAFRAVWLEVGDHRIEMVCRPRSFRTGIILSLAGMGLIAALAGSRRRFRWGIGGGR
jgi:hypothetical protein